jgi:putative thioredoxin
MIDITVENFEQEVVAASAQTPVLIDFWAEWCGPCKALGPILEKLEKTYGGAFTLAKVDTEAQQELAAAFQIRSIPTCILFKGGKPVDGFQGALPEGQLKQFLEKHLPKPQEMELAAARKARAEGDKDTAQRKLKAALALDPGFDEARFDLIELYLDAADNENAKLEAAKIAPKNHVDPRWQAIDARLHAAKKALQLPGVDKLQAAITANPKNLQARLDLAEAFISVQAYEEALEQLLEIVKIDKAFNDGIGRKKMVDVFNMAGAQPEMVGKWRRALSTALN